MLWIILWILLFMFLVIIHELWHFIAAKKTGVQVLEFGLWIPPKVATLWKDKSWTEYTLNAIPLGGFVRLKGEDPSDTDTFTAKDSFVSASFLSKTIILIAGVVVNFIFAWIALVFLFTRGIVPISIVPEGALSNHVDSYLMPTISFLQSQWFIHSGTIQVLPQIDMIQEWGIAYTLWLQVDDTIVSINEIPADIFNLPELLQQSIWKDMDLIIQREEDNIAFTVKCPEDSCLLGMTVSPNNTINENVYYKFPLWTSMKIASHEMYSLWRITLEKLWWLGKSFVSGNKEIIQKELSSLSGPVWAVKIWDVLVDHRQWSQFIAFGALISLSLAVFNILPIPALDWGRWVGVVIQTLFFRKNIKKYTNIEGYINFVFFMLLMWLGIYIIFKDLAVVWGMNIPFIG